MTNHGPLLAGLLVGFAVAVPIGPMGLLCVQRTLTSGMKVGVSTGLGAVTVNVTYGGMILLGLDAFAPWLASGRRFLGVLGGLFLLWSAARLLLRRDTLKQRPENAARSPVWAYGSAVAFNATNPMALMLVMALLSSAVGGTSPSLGDAILLLLGMFTAATTWWVCLSGGVALLRTHLRPTVLWYVNQIAGMLLTIYGTLALARSVRM
jgi:threonine/homoserine/homoserine lactone efflux protein